jgi:hypothetical protein
MGPGPRVDSASPSVSARPMPRFKLSEAGEVLRASITMTHAAASVSRRGTTISLRATQRNPLVEGMRCSGHRSRDSEMRMRREVARNSQQNSQHVRPPVRVQRPFATRHSAGPHCSMGHPHELPHNLTCPPNVWWCVSGVPSYGLQPRLRLSEDLRGHSALARRIGAQLAGGTGAPAIHGAPARAAAGVPET